MYRAPAEGAAAAEAYRRATQAYEALQQRQPHLHRANLELARRNEQALVIPEYLPPTPPSATIAPAALAAYVRQVDDMAAYYTYELQRHDAALAQLTQAGQQEAQAAFQLGPPERAVPLPYLLAELLRGTWLALRWNLFPPIGMGAAMVIVPLGLVHPALLYLPLVGVQIYALVRFSRRRHYLARAEVPTIVARSLFFTRTRNSSVPRLFANGWRIRASAYTGLTMQTELTYRTSHGIIGKTSVYGPEFHGHLLVLPDRPDAALPNTAFACCPEPDERGQWRGAVPARVRITNALGVLLAFAYAAYVTSVVLKTLGH